MKIIGIDSGADTDAFTSFLTTDNVKGGSVAADALADAIKAKTGKAEGEVALITALPGVGSLDQRAKGFKDTLAAKYPGIKLVSEKVADGQATTGLNIMTDLITANPNLVGVFASNLPMAQGAGQALAENADAQKKLVLVGFDSDDKLVGLLKQGVISALIVQDPYRMGYDGVKTALAASKGESVPKNVDTGRQPDHQGEPRHAAVAGTSEPEAELRTPAAIPIAAGVGKPSRGLHRPRDPPRARRPCSRIRKAIAR